MHFSSRSLYSNYSKLTQLSDDKGVDAELEEYEMLKDPTKREEEQPYTALQCQTADNMTTTGNNSGGPQYKYIFFHTGICPSMQSKAMYI